MNYSCGNCKYMKYREEYLFPYKCEKDKAKSYMREEIDRRINIGYKCDKYKCVFEEEK